MTFPRIAKKLNWFLLLLILAPGLAFAQPTVNLILDDGSMDEATLGTGQITITRTDDGDTGSAKNVYFSFAGSMTRDADFSYSGMVFYGGNIFYITIPANVLSASATITPLKDNFIEGEDSLTFTLLEGDPYGSTYIVGLQNEVNLTLTDDVAIGGLILDDGSMDEANLGTAQVTVTRSDQGKVADALNIYFTFAGSATRNADYSFTGMIFYGGNIYYITIPAELLSASAILTPVRDLVLEGDETLTFTLQEGAAYGSGYSAEPNITVDIVILDLVDVVFKDGFEQGQEEQR